MVCSIKLLLIGAQLKCNKSAKVYCAWEQLSALTSFDLPFRTVSEHGVDLGDEGS